MITASDIILKLIKDKGYKTILDFCEKHKILYGTFVKDLNNNIWTKKMLEKVSNALNVDLLKYKNS